MRFYPVKTPQLLKRLFPHYTWHRDRSQKEIFLTIDDGPTAELNPMIMSILEEYSVKATFFCVGENLVRNEKDALHLMTSGHRLANHTHKHYNGWNTSLDDYVGSIEDCATQLGSLGVDNCYFRPPYGRITRKQAAEVMKKGYEIIMWDVLSGDFDRSLSPAKCLDQTLRHTENGSIIVFHDNTKAAKTLEYVLPRFIEAMKGKGFQFKLL